MAKPNPTIQNAADKAHNVVDNAAKAAQQVDTRARETTEQVIEKAAETVDSVKQTTGNAQERLTEYVNENPLRSVGIAFGAGLVAAALLRK